MREVDKNDLGKIAQWFDKKLDALTWSSIDFWYERAFKFIAFFVLVAAFVTIMLSAGFISVLITVLSWSAEASKKASRQISFRLKRRRLNKEAQREYEAFVRSTLAARDDINAVINQAVAQMSNEQLDDILKRWEL